MISAWVRSTACFASLKGASGLLRIDAVGDRDVDRLDRSRRAAVLDLIAAEGAGLERREVRSVAGERNVGNEFALEHLPGEQQLAALVLVADGVADEGAIQGRGQLGGEVAHLVGVRHQHQLGLLLLDEAFQRRHKAVGSIGLELGRLEVVHLRDALGGNFVGDVADAAADHGRFQGPPGFRRDGLCSGERLPRNAVQLAVPLLHYNQNSVCHFDPFLRPVLSACRTLLMSGTS